MSRVFAQRCSANVRSSKVSFKSASSLLRGCSASRLECSSHLSMHARRTFGATEKAMKEKDITLPPFQPAVWSYVKAQRDGNKLYIGDHVGQVLNEENGQFESVRGKVGDEGDEQAEISPEKATELAENCALRLLSTLSHYLDGDLDKVDQVIMLNGYVNGTAHFRGHGKVIDGCSKMLVSVLGERGKHARTCVGAGSLPAAVTCDMVVRIKE